MYIKRRKEYYAVKPIYEISCSVYIHESLRDEFIQLHEYGECER